MKSRFNRKPTMAIIQIVRRSDGYTVRKTIRNSARTADLVTQYHSRHPDYFVYRVNCYEGVHPRD